jgi:hypothetical protein
VGYNRVILTPRLWVILLGFGLALPIGPAWAAQESPAAGRKQAVAVRVAGDAIRLDGRLDEAAWASAIPITDFVQKEPEEGAPPSEGLAVRIVYDDGGLYVGARLSKGPASPLQAPMGRRDRGEQAEHFLVALDTFLDRRTAYVFGVTAAGVRLDRFHPGDDEAVFDEGFDPVWAAETALDADGWTAELWIPFSQLRFTARPAHIWGLNLQRFTPSRNEQAYWVPVPRTTKGWASRFGELRGVEGLRSTRRIEVLPYVAGSSTINGNRDRDNPFDDGRNLSSRGGADLKVGLGPNLTLDATVNPDFGQVEADPAEVNLTAFETTFTEKRTFFVEGAQLLNLRPIDNLFYSRRVGAPPLAPASGDFVDYPAAAAIIAAAKVTGRLASGTSLGMLAAVTDEESARVGTRGSAVTSKVRVAPRTMLGLARIQQEFGPNASTVSGMITFLHRDVERGDPLASLLARSALTGGSDALLRFKGGEYELNSHVAFSAISGDAPAIERVQRSSAHYFQRPDQTYAMLDPTRTSMAGFKTGSMLERTGGRHWLWYVSTQVESPEFETNDLGRLRSSDAVVLNADLRFRETQPGPAFRSYAIGSTSMNEWNFAGDRQIASLAGYVNLTWNNFWYSALTVTRAARILDQRLTRGGPLMETPRGWTFDLQLRNSSAASTGWSTQAVVGTNEDGGSSLRVEGSLTVRPGARWQFSVEPTTERQVSTQQYVSTLDEGRAETFGRRYVFSSIDRSTYSMQFRLGYTFRPDMNLDVYAEPFAASGRYYGPGELAAPTARQLREYGLAPDTSATELPGGGWLITDGDARFRLENRDFNLRSFRSNVVLRWEWRPGSTLYVVWQQNRRESDGVGRRIDLGDVFGSLTAEGSNAFVVKTSVWFPIR